MIFRLSFCRLAALFALGLTGAAPLAAGEAGAAGEAAAPIILLKLDDVTARGNQPQNAVSPRWQRVADFIEQNELKAGFGIICFSLETDNPAYFQWIKERQARGKIEFWLHGYRARTKEDKTGEYEQGTFEEQRAVFAKCEELAKEKLGFEFKAFGPHWSGTTDATDQALEATPEVKLWLYGPKQPKYFKRVSVPRVMAIENPTFVPDAAKFAASYEKQGAAQKVLVLQGHPDQWTDERWAGFLKIIDFLKSKGCSFMTPTEYLQSLEGAK